jgi:UDP-N-acetylmuramate dehydrogenase
VHFETSKPLQSLNTFGIDVHAAHYVAVEDAATLPELLTSGRPELSEILVLGGGSNILFTEDFDGCVLHMCNRGVVIEHEDDRYAFVRVEAGEEWDAFVQFCLDHNLGGVENLIAIPGRVGAAPVQNIGAYGTEVGNVIFEVDMVLLENGSRITMPAFMCEFGYRTSIFKTALKGQVVITSVLFRLSKYPEVNAGYGDVQKRLAEVGIEQPSIQDVAHVIRRIRDAKLPDPKITGNAGSFFKNPVVSEEIVTTIRQTYPDMPVYAQEDGTMKLAAGWLIEQCKLKGFRMGNAAVHDKQALVLVNLGEATGIEVVTLANHIIKMVWLKFGVRLEPEVNIL